jgi:serine/threonine-protein kinase
MRRSGKRNRKPGRRQGPGIGRRQLRLRKQTESDAAIARLARQRGEFWAYAVAQAHAYRGEREQALDWLDKAYEARDSDLQFILNDPLLQSVRGDSRFKELLRKMHLPE